MKYPLKLEGKSFERVRAKDLAFERVKKEAGEMVRAAHKELWDTINAEAGSSEDDDLALNCKYSDDLNFYLIEEAKEARGGMPKELRKLLKELVK